MLDPRWNLLWKLKGDHPKLISPKVNQDPLWNKCLPLIVPRKNYFRPLDELR